MDRLNDDLRKLPEAFFEALSKEDFRAFAIKAPGELDENELNGAQLEISEEGFTLGAEMVLRARPLCQYLAMSSPYNGDKELSFRRAMASFELQGKSKMLINADKKVDRALRELEGLIETEDAAEEGLRPERAKRKWDMRESFKLTGLLEPLLSVGWDLEEMDHVLEEDAWAGTGEAPRKRSKSCFSALAQQHEKEEEKERLKEFFGSWGVEVVALTEEESLPVCFWPFSDFSNLQGQELKLHRVRELEGLKVRRHLLKGSFQSLQLEAQEEEEAKILMALLRPKKKKVLLCRASLYHLAVLQPEEVAPDLEALGAYYEQRNKATMGFGTEKRIRSNQMMRERVTRNCEVAALDRCKELIQANVEKESGKPSSYEKDLSLKKELLPAYFDTDVPAAIYADGLASIASERNMEKEARLLDSSLLEILKLPSNEISKLDEKDPALVEACGGYLMLQVLLAKARQAKGELKDVKETARKFGVLRLLLKLGQACIKRKGRFGRKQLAEVIGLHPGSPLLYQLHQYFFDAMTGQQAVRVLNARRILCGIIVWALYLTDDLWFDVTRQVQNELGFMKANLKLAFEFVGCRVEDKATERAQKGETWRVQLVQAPQYDGTFYDQQIMPAKSGKKKGKGKGR